MEVAFDYWSGICNIFETHEVVTQQNKVIVCWVSKKTFDGDTVFKIHWVGFHFIVHNDDVFDVSAVW